MNKPFISYEKGKEKMNDRGTSHKLDIEDYTVSIFYVNGNDEKQTRLEVRRF
mgnify:CR=1 FL=1